jgi:hypothetical protein
VPSRCLTSRHVDAHSPQLAADKATPALRALVLRMARKNARWGYRRSHD